MHGKLATTRDAIKTANQVNQPLRDPGQRHPAAFGSVISDLRVSAQALDYYKRPSISVTAIIDRTTLLPVAGAATS